MQTGILHRQPLIRAKVNTIQHIASIGMLTKVCTSRIHQNIKIPRGRANLNSCNVRNIVGPVSVWLESFLSQRYDLLDG